MKQGPAYSAAFEPGSLEALRPTLPLEGVTPEWAWGESTGAGVKVAIVDSGIDSAHPAVGGSVAAYLQFHDAADGLEVDWSPHNDVSGHGTACAGIIRSLAPDCELYSIRILGPRL